MEKRPRTYPNRGRRTSALDYPPTPAGPAPFSPAPVGLIAVRPQQNRSPGKHATRQLPPKQRPGWEQRYLRTLIGLDLTAAAAAGALAYLFRFGGPVTSFTRTYLILSLLLPF